VSTVDINRILRQTIITYMKYYIVKSTQKTHSFTAIIKKQKSRSRWWYAKK